MKTNGYTKCYVAFLDILGAKEIMKGKSFDEVKSIYKTIGISIALNIEEYDYDIRFKIISDSIVSYMPKRIKNSFEIIICVACSIAISLFNEGVTVRGGIALGDLCDMHNSIFGRALVDAYELETIAKNPRIIIQDELVRTGLQSLKTIEGKSYVARLLLDTEDADIREVDYMYYIFERSSINDFNLPQFEMFFHKIHNTISNGLQHSKPEIKSKYEWLSDYYKKSLNKAKEQLKVPIPQYCELD